MAIAMATGRWLAKVVGSGWCLFSLLMAPAAAGATSFELSAVDAGFVTEAGGSAKGDGTLVSSARYNYSAGIELHYGTGALGAPLVPMMRKNYFVFDLGALDGPIASAKLVLWTGTLESVDGFEDFVLVETTEVGPALGLAAALAGGESSADFDEPGDPLVGDAKSLFGLLGDGAILLGGIGLTADDDDTFVEIAFTPAALGYLSSFVGGKLVLAGLVPTTIPGSSPQQPFGLTGPDIPGGDPKTPMLVVTTVPEPPMVLMSLFGVLAVMQAARGCRRRSG